MEDKEHDWTVPQMSLTKTVTGPGGYSQTIILKIIIPCPLQILLEGSMAMCPIETV